MADTSEKTAPKPSESKPDHGLRGVRTTSLFRAVNFELFARQNKYVMGFGLIALSGCVAYVAYLNAVTENKKEGLYELHRQDGTKEMSVKKTSKWD